MVEAPAFIVACPQISMRMSIPPGDVDSASGFVHRALEQCVHK